MEVSRINCFCFLCGLPAFVLVSIVCLCAVLIVWKRKFASATSRPKCVSHYPASFCHPHKPLSPFTLFISTGGSKRTGLYFRKRRYEELGEDQLQVIKLLRVSKEDYERCFHKPTGADSPADQVVKR